MVTAREERPETLAAEDVPEGQQRGEGGLVADEVVGIQVRSLE